MDYPKLENLNPSNCTERSIEKHYPEFWEYIIKNYHCEKWTERLYWFYHDLNDYPKCPVCGKNTSFINIKTGYREFCSQKCMNSSEVIKMRKKQTSFKNFGVESPMKSPEIKKKLKESIQKKYGVDNVFQLNDVKNKTKQTCLEKYGVFHHLQNPHIKQKLINTIRNKNIWADKYLIGYTDEGKQIRKCPHKNCNKCQQKYYIIPTSIYFDRKRLNTETCTNLLKIGAKHDSSLEQKILILLDEFNIPYIRNDRKIMGNKKEVDIYIPSKNIAIECNGIWAHSTMNNKDPKPKKYHQNKTVACKANNVELIHLWEDWILFKYDIVKSLILNKLGLINNSIYARKCVVKEIPIEICNKFLNENHIQGKTNSMIRLGLFYNNFLVSVMTFKLNKNQWELNRFCTKINMRVPGAASKLLKYFIKMYNPKSIISFSSNDISSGNLYKKLGFQTDHKINQSYWYFEPGSLKRYHRSSFTKEEIVRRGWRDKIDDTWTEFEVMEEHGYFQIYDSGQLKWVMNM